MGYRALKEKAEEKRKLFKRIALCIFAVLLVAITLFSFFVPPASWKYYFSKPKVATRKAGELRIHFLDVGQGDSTLIELPDGKVVLIDGGGKNGRAKGNLMRYLNALRVDVIDYLVVTHTDEDHCGGLTEVFKYKKVLNAYLPLSFSTEAVTYAAVYDAAIKEGCPLIAPTRSVDLSCADTDAPYTLRFLCPYASEAAGWENFGADNDASAVLWLDYFGTSALFTGDASLAVEQALLRDDGLGLFNGVTLSQTEILKVSHHGSADATSAEFLTRLGVKTAVISCGKDNAYGHPSKDVLARLNAVGAETFRTDIEGHVLLTATKEGKYSINRQR